MSLSNRRARATAVGGLLLAALLAACGSARRDDAVAATQPTLRELATAWSGGQETPVCQDRGPRGELLGTSGQQYCEWRPPTGATVRGTVSAIVDADGEDEYTLLTWERPTDGPDDARRIEDSLATAFAARGLATHRCGIGDVPAGRVEARLWNGPALSVFLSRITPADGAPRLMTMVMQRPASELPPVVCPGVGSDATS